MDFDKLKEQVLKKKVLVRIIYILIGVFLLALNYNLFLLPNHFVIGGMSGLSIVFQEIFGWNPTIFIYISSAILIIVSYFALGLKKTGTAIIGSVFYPLMISLTVPIGNALKSYLIFDNILITVIVCAIINGIATGMIYKAGFSTGGSDILIKILNKYLHLPEGKCVLIVNTIIIIIGGFVFGINQVIYAILILVIYTGIVDTILIGISNSKQFFIYTKETKKVRDFIVKEMKTGVTILETEGGYSKKKGQMLMCVVPTRDYYLFKETVLTIDPTAFFVINDCYEVRGGKRRNLPFI